MTQGSSQVHLIPTSLPGHLKPNSLDVLASPRQFQRVNPDALAIRSMQHKASPEHPGFAATVGYLWHIAPFWEQGELATPCHTIWPRSDQASSSSSAACLLDFRQAI